MGGRNRRLGIDSTRRNFRKKERKKNTGESVYMLCLFLLSLFQFNSTLEPRMYLHYERNHIGNISTSCGVCVALFY